MESKRALVLAAMLAGASLSAHAGGMIEKIGDKVKQANETVKSVNEVIRNADETVEGVDGAKSGAGEVVKDTGSVLGGDLSRQSGARQSAPSQSGTAAVPPAQSEPQSGAMHTQKRIDDGPLSKPQPAARIPAMRFSSKWDENPYDAWVDGVWDSAVLPVWVPKEISGVKTEQTSYKAKHKQDLQDLHEAGDLYFPDSNHEEWHLSFYCTDAQLQTFVDGLASQEGFVGGQTDESPLIYEWVGQGWYVYLRVNTQAMGQAGYNNLAMFTTSPVYHALPAKFQGTRLPQIGMSKYGFDEWAVIDENADDWKGYDIKTDRGSLPSGHWFADFDYFGVTNSDVKAYVQQMKADGWTISYENTDDDGSYGAQLKKGAVYAYTRYSSYGYSMELEFATMPEMLGN